MTYSQIYAKITAVIRSCTSRQQRWNGFSYCTMLINKYLTGAKADSLEDYLINFMAK